MNTNIQIRNAKLDDAEIIADGWVRSIRQLCAPAYNNDSELIERWTKNKKPENIRQIISNDDVAIVALFEKQVAGIGCAKFDQEKVACYVWPEYTARGIGKALIGSIEKSALERGLDNFKIHASFNAVGFYQKLGYIATGQILYYDHIGCMAMNKVLNLKPAYFLAQIYEIYENDTYMEYVRQVPAIVEEFGGKYLSSGQAETITDKEAVVRAILIKFPSAEAIKQWFNSPQYRKLAPLRERSARASCCILHSCNL